MTTKEIEISYGSGNITLNIPEERLGGVYEPREMKDPSDEDMAEAVHEAGVAEVCSGRRVCLLLEDGTRGDNHGIYLKALLPALQNAGQVNVIIATGSHDPSGSGNVEISSDIKTLLDHTGINNSVAINDCRNSRFTRCGATQAETDVFLNSIADDAETVLLPSTMKPHYFAGYSNPIKNIVPGIAAFKTIEQNHSLALESDSTFCRHPLHSDEMRRSNPVAEDMLEAARLYLEGRQAIAIATVGPNVFVDDSCKAASEAMDKVDELMACSVKPERYIIVSPGNLNEGRDLYHAQRGLELTRNVVLDGGEILFAAEMSGGIAYDDATRRNFHDRLKCAGDISVNRGNYVLYSHKAVKLNDLISKVSAIHVFSSLDDSSLKEIRMQPAKDCQDVIDTWLEKDSEARILVFKNANKLAVYQKVEGNPS